MEDQSIKVREQGTIKIRYTTAMIFGAIIFLASLFSGWLTQTRDIGAVAAEQKVLQSTLSSQGNRITVLEQCIIATKDTLLDVKEELKEIRKGQKDMLKELSKPPSKSKGTE